MGTDRICIMFLKLLFIHFHETIIKLKLKQPLWNMLHSKRISNMSVTYFDYCLS